MRRIFEEITSERNVLVISRPNGNKVELNPRRPSGECLPGLMEHEGQTPTPVPAPDLRNS